MSGESSDRLGELLARDELSVIEHGGAAAVVHQAGAAPYESHAEDGTWPSGSGTPQARRAAMSSKARSPGTPGSGRKEPKHMHFVPRLTALAGIELGAGLYVNVPPPEAAAERLRR